MALYAFDGTWNTNKDGDEENYRETNVVRFLRPMPANSGLKNFYVAGIGTRLGRVGRGDRRRIRRRRAAAARRSLRSPVRELGRGDHVIDVIGFSRGAATALDFCNLVAHRGIRKPSTAVDGSVRARVAEVPLHRPLGCRRGVQPRCRGLRLCRTSTSGTS